MSETTALVESPTGGLSFSDASRFDHIQRVATMFSKSQLVPTIFQNNVPNVVIGLEMAQRLGASPLMVLQNISVVHGKPSFSASFMIATVNACGRFTPLRPTYVGKQGDADWGCYVVAKAKSDGAECKGALVTFAIAEKEGWVGRNGSKWKSFPELMLYYRAATWWTRMYAPELLMGFPTADEAIEIESLPNDIPASVTTTVTTDAPARPKKDKGVAGMKKADAPTPAASAPADTPATEPPKTEAPPAENPKPEEPPVSDSATADEAALFDAPPPKKVFRIEIVDGIEKVAKKAGGTMGQVCTLSVKGEYLGTVYYDGTLDSLPANGAVIDAVLVEKYMKGTKVRILESFTSVA